MLVLVLLSNATLLMRAQTVRAQGANQASMTLINLSFPGGTISEYLEALRQAAGKAVNIAMSSAQAGLPSIPAVELAEVDLESAIHLIEGDYSMEDGTVIEVRVDTLSALGGSRGNPLFRVSAESVKSTTLGQHVKVWSFTELLDDHLSAEDALTAVELAVKLVNSPAGTAKVSFHAASSLLVAQGSSDQLEAIDSVVDQLQEGHHQRKRHIEAEEGSKAYADGIEQFTEWIKEMRQFDASQQEIERQHAAAAEQQSAQAPGGDLRRAMGHNGEKTEVLLREVERLSRVVEVQKKTIQSLEQRLTAAPKKP
jgi:hypothetical protein